MNLENWQIAALNHDLLEDPSVWAQNAVDGKAFPDVESAIEHKINRCAERMISAHEASNGSFVSSYTIEEKVNICIAEPGYKNRAEREC